MGITVGIPAYNEEKNIASIIIKLQKIALEWQISSKNHPKIAKKVTKRWQMSTQKSPINYKK